DDVDGLDDVRELGSKRLAPADLVAMHRVDRDDPVAVLVEVVGHVKPRSLARGRRPEHRDGSRAKQDLADAVEAVYFACVHGELHWFGCWPGCQFAGAGAWVTTRVPQ